MVCIEVDWEYGADILIDTTFDPPWYPQPQTGEGLEVELGDIF